MPGVEFHGAPFGSATARFNVSGIHPQLKPLGTYTEAPYCSQTMSNQIRALGPGRYNPECSGGFGVRAVSRRASGPGWAREVELSRSARTPHFRHREAWEKERTQKSRLGPGIYDTKDFIDLERERPSSRRGVCDTLEERFLNIGKSSTPGPGSYVRPERPGAAWAHHPASRGPMELSSSVNRSTPETGSGLGPGTHEHRSFTDELAARVVSARGPYDLFTGRRTDPLRTGWLVAPESLWPGPRGCPQPSMAEALAARTRNGRFAPEPGPNAQPGLRLCLDAPAHCRREPSWPGPGTYAVNLEAREVRSASRPPFLSSSARFNPRSDRLFMGSQNPVGPGRYNPRTPAPPPTPRANATPSSSSRRYLADLAWDKYMRERLRPLNMRPEVGQPRLGIATR
ncbi:ciliary microtubule-associated protein 2 [Petromyzon marinus]|uniref:ciliary microtubule-associated protein 2 n=1 Tax=Petromyzon marinus TaxID=7757 RepID=UPI003F70689D